MVIRIVFLRASENRPCKAFRRPSLFLPNRCHPHLVPVIGKLTPAVETRDMRSVLPCCDRKSSPPMGAAEQPVNKPAHTICEPPKFPTRAPPPGVTGAASTFGGWQKAGSGPSEGKAAPGIPA